MNYSRPEIWTDLRSIILGERNQMQKTVYVLCDSIYFGNELMCDLGE